MLWVFLAVVALTILVKSGSLADGCLLLVLLGVNFIVFAGSKLWGTLLFLVVLAIIAAARRKNTW